MSTVRPLPARPSLEHERKQAKSLLRRLRAGDAEALARARFANPRLDVSTPHSLQLADAQLTLAREYGFPSWPRLVHYFGEMARQQYARPQLHGGREVADAGVRSLVAEHRAGRESAGRTLAGYVPRFTGMRVEDVIAASITDDDVQLAIARRYAAPSWAVLLERLEAAAGARDPWRPRNRRREAAAAMAAGDIGGLERLVEQHPQLLRPSEQDVATNATLIAYAVQQEQRLGVDAMRPVMAWLAARDFDRQHELNRRLCGRIHMPAEEVRDLLDRGADPNWVAPSGIPVLEHALLRYWNAEAIDVLAAHSTPRHALWIAAGLGDLATVRGFVDAQGCLTPAARELRPDYVAVGPFSGPVSLADPDDSELLFEALFVAMINGRTAVMEYLASCGAPVNSAMYGEPLASFAVGNGMAAAFERLVRIGADLDLRGWHPKQTAREIARDWFEADAANPERRRIVELCGLDPAAIVAERDARPAPVPVRHSSFDAALELATDDALRLGRASVDPENLLVGLLRGGGLALQLLAQTANIDLRRLFDDMGERLRAPADRVTPLPLPLDAQVAAAVAEALVPATAHKRELVYDLHLLAALAAAGDPALTFLVSYGASAAAVREALDPLL